MNNLYTSSVARAKSTTDLNVPLQWLQLRMRATVYMYGNRAVRQDQLNSSPYKSGYRPGVLICPAEHMGCWVCEEQVYMHMQLLHILHMNSLTLPHNALCSTS